MSAVGLALDLGSTRYKAALAQSDGTLPIFEALSAPPLEGVGAIRECDPSLALDTVNELRRRLLERAPGDLPLGISCQRSTFTLQSEPGRFVTPLISWQDTRAADWCRRHAGHAERFHQLSGLRLSAHYIGPKLAALAEADAELGRRLRRGQLQLRLLDGLTLESWGAEPSLDRSMAARSGLLDITRGAWSEELCQLFGVDPKCLPPLRRSDAIDAPLDNGVRCRATLADQSAALLSLTGLDPTTLLINLGTGAFVLRSTGERLERRPGYLTAILQQTERLDYAIEGAISGSGPALDRHRVELDDPTVEAGEPLFAVPDGAGLGAPHWRADIQLRFSEERASETARYRALLEGLAYRVREIHDDLCSDEPPRRVLLAGGGTREPHLVRLIATLLEREVDCLTLSEASLLGAAFAANPSAQRETPARTTVRPDGRLASQQTRYARWRDWVATLLER